MKETVLEEAARLITGDRRDDYGDAVASFRRLGTLWTTILGDALNRPIRPSEVALLMIGLKVLREQNATKRDNWVDIAGYAGLGDQVAESGDPPPASEDEEEELKLERRLRFEEGGVLERMCQDVNTGLSKGWEPFRVDMSQGVHKRLMEELESADPVDRAFILGHPIDVKIVNALGDDQLAMHYQAEHLVSPAPEGVEKCVWSSELGSSQPWHAGRPGRFHSLCGKPKAPAGEILTQKSRLGHLDRACEICEKYFPRDGWPGSR